MRNRGLAESVYNLWTRYRTEMLFTPAPFRLGFGASSKGHLDLGGMDITIETKILSTKSTYGGSVKLLTPNVTIYFTVDHPHYNINPTDDDFYLTMWTSNRGDGMTGVVTDCLIAATTTDELAEHDLALIRLLA